AEAQGCKEKGHRAADGGQQGGVVVLHHAEARLGKAEALGFGTWQATVATVTGLIAKENVVSTLGVLFGLGADLTEEDPGLLAAVGTHFTALSAYSFMIFNLLCAPCFAAMGAIKREMNNARWTLGAIGYMCGFAYVVSLIVYQLGGLM
ncbi:hypothetical protein NE659_25330, partial [Flavonifractor plautii]|uniref:nucleoside recognition domain-containing protein n=1 Tax=Flavonifractor plautii TaxID=292800 RepID=UPI0027310B23